MDGVLDQADLVVKRRPQLIERRGGYDIYNERTGESVGVVEQVGRDNVEKMLHPRRIDNARTPFELRDASGPVLLMTHVQAARSSLVVEHPDGSVMGQIQVQNYFGKKRLTVDVTAAMSWTISARTWRNKNFAVVDERGAEISSIDMTLGTSGDHSHNNHYAVHIAPALTGQLRALAFAGVIAVDRIVWTR